MKFIFSFVLLLSNQSFAMSIDQFNFISGLLHSGKMDPAIDCSIKVREIKEERKFIGGTELIDFLKLEFTTPHIWKRSTTISIPKDLPIEISKVHDRERGYVEEIKIQLNDTLYTRLVFHHDGDRITYFEIVDIYAMYLCGLKPNRGR